MVSVIYDTPPPYNFTGLVKDHLEHKEYMENTFDLRYWYLGVGIPYIDWLTDGVVEAGPPPPWANFTDIEGFLKPVWETYITAKLRYTSADLYLIPAAPLGWLDSSPEELEQNWQLLKWEIETIRNMKPSIRLGIVLSGGWNGTGTPSDTDLFKFLEKMFAEGIDIEVIGVEYHPGLDGCSPNISDMEEYYHELTKFNRDIFIWEFFANSNGSELYPDPGWYTEDWQAHIYSEALRLAFENPYIIGINYICFGDYPPEHARTGNESNVYQGFTRADFTPKPSFYQTRDYWRSTFVSGQGVTDENGEIRFTGYPGTYEITIGDKVYRVEFARPRIVP